MIKKKILLIDSEGGHGGSSKSLFTLIKYLNKRKLYLKVLCKKDSWIKKEYSKIGVKCQVIPFLPTYTVLDTINKNIYALAIFILNKLLLFFIKKEKFKNLIRNYDLIHLNHSNLWFLALWIKFILPEKKITVHIRTLPYRNIFSKCKYKILLKYTDKQIFITENEYNHFKSLTGLSPSNIIIYNSVEKNKTNKKKYSHLKNNKKFLIGSFSNYSFYRGTDRIFEVAKLLPKEILEKIKFVIVGDIKIPNGAKKKLKFLMPYNNLKEYANENNLKKYFSFLGHIKDVENILINLDITLKLTREFNPWGRDILESMFYKVPAISIGSYNMFVKNKYSGVLLSNYSAKKVADEIIFLLKNKDFLSKLKINSKKIVSEYCNPKVNAKKIENLWLKL